MDDTRFIELKKISYLGFPMSTSETGAIKCECCKDVQPVKPVSGCVKTAQLLQILAYTLRRERTAGCCDEKLFVYLG